MLQFSFWDILSNLLIATQWTIVLSLIAFVCGGGVGLILLFMRTSKVAPLEWFTKIYIDFKNFCSDACIVLSSACPAAEIMPVNRAHLWDQAFLRDLARCQQIQEAMEPSPRSLLCWQMRYIPAQAWIAFPTVGFSVR